MKLKLLIIFLLALILRIINLNQSFWMDEAAQVTESLRPFSQQTQIVADFHPPLYHILLHFWMYLGTSEVWVRLLSVIFALGSILIIYKLVLCIGDRKEALISALFLTLSPYHLWYSQEARPYMLFVLLSLLSTYMLIRHRWIQYTVVTLLMVYSLYFALFLIIGHLVYIYLFEKSYLKKCISSLLVVFVLFLPWIPEFIKQLEVGLNGVFRGWTNIVSVSPVKVIPLVFAKFIFGRGSIENNLVYTLIVLPMFIVFIIGFIKSLSSKNGKIILILFTVPLIISFIISLFIPVVAPQRLIFLLPFFLMIIVKGVSSFPKNLKYLGITIAVLTSFGGIYQYYTDPYVAREQWRQAVSFVEETGTSDSIVLFVFPAPFAPYSWYQKGKIQSTGIAPKFILRDEDIRVLSYQLENKNRVYLFQYLTDLTDPDKKTQRFLEMNNYKNNITQDFPGVGFVYIYDKK